METTEAASDELTRKMDKEPYGEEATWTTREEAVQACAGKALGALNDCLR